MDYVWFPFFLLAFILIILLTRPQKKKVPPGPSKLPIIGNLPQLGDLPHRSLCDFSFKYGSLMFIKIGFLSTFVVSFAETAKEIFKTYDLHTYSNYWRELKKLVVCEIFSIKRIQSFQFIWEDEVSLLLDVISQAASSSNPINLTHQIFTYNASIIFRMALGYNFRGSDHDKSSFHRLLHNISSLLGEFSAEDYLPNLGWIIDRVNSHHEKLERVFHELDTIFQNAIYGHLHLERNDQQNKDIIDVMMELDKDNQYHSNKSSLQSDNIKGLLMNIFFGGIDTSANTVMWAMTELIRNPRVMKIA
ncbi:cytochrome P450 71B36-like [Carica papaya]|uniref:cytochrome P450 71B36-like n=1 Tax=Carica papaya TaxID=3649 RepID=UPI000B8CA3DC|nr:cytochrome P450 71B36-like [Carica papaya]